MSKPVEYLIAAVIGVLLLVSLASCWLDEGKARNYQEGIKQIELPE